MKVKDTYFTDDSGEPLFWLADTAWNTALRSDEDDWRKYLAVRAEQGFTVIQFVATQWRGCTQPLHGLIFEEKDGRFQINHRALAKIGRFIELINEYKMVAAPVMLWAWGKEDPGQTLSESSAVEICREMVKQWQKYEVVWFLAGDGNYTSDEVSGRWCRIGRQVFNDYPDAVATMHPCGVNWIGDIFADEPWFSFVGIQSGHGDSADHLKWLLNGPYANEWKKIKMPFINMEPNYEEHPAYHSGAFFTDYHVRRASYWSLLSAPTAGVSYGHNAIWPWNSVSGGDAEGHHFKTPIAAWHERLKTSGTDSMTIMKKIFSKIPWFNLLPAPSLLEWQPGNSNIDNFVSIAADREMNIIVVYSPCGGMVQLKNDFPLHDKKLFWVNPRNGLWAQIKQKFIEPSDIYCFNSPDDNDWLLVIRKET